MDYSPPGFSVHGIFQARILEGVAISFSKGSSWPREACGRLESNLWLADSLLLRQQGAYGKFSINLIIPSLHIIMCQGVCVFDSFLLKELVEYYKHHSLKEGFRTLDTTLQFPYKEPEHSTGQRGNRAGISCEYCNLEYNLLTPKDWRHDNIEHLHFNFEIEPIYTLMNLTRNFFFPEQSRIRWTNRFMNMPRFSSLCQLKIIFVSNPSEMKGMLICKFCAFPWLLY